MHGRVVDKVSVKTVRFRVVERRENGFPCCLGGGHFSGVVEEKEGVDDDVCSTLLLLVDPLLATARGGCVVCAFWGHYRSEAAPGGGKSPKILVGQVVEGCCFGRAEATFGKKWSSPDIEERGEFSAS